MRHDRAIPALTAHDLPLDAGLRPAIVTLLKRGVPMASIAHFFATSPEQLQLLVGVTIAPPRIAPNKQRAA